MDFHDIRFPIRLAFGARGGPRRQISITALSNGTEQRNAAQRFSRRVYDAGTALKSLDDIYTLLNFFEARQGPLYAFRFRDPFDFKSSASGAPITALDQAIGTGNGRGRDFRLSKIYGDDAGHVTRLITKPIADSVRIAVDGLVTSEFLLNAQTGEVRLTNAPRQGGIITAGFEFDTPVRFDAPQLDISLDSFGAGEIPSIPLIEVLDHA
jgi:uncharacterized protein (TIGR02217 family)